MDDVFSAEMQALSARALQRLRAAGCAIADETALSRLALASDFAIDALRPAAGAAGAAAGRCGVAGAPRRCWSRTTRANGHALLRRYRQAESTRLVWRDVVDGADVEEILAGSSALAETCLRLALDALEADFARRLGVVRDADGAVAAAGGVRPRQAGRRELNFCSDIDLVYAYEHEGESDGARTPARRRTISRGWASSWRSCWTR